MDMWLHKHPVGMRFKRAEATNEFVVEMTRRLIDGPFGSRGNGWHSWKDVHPESAQCGRYVLFNVATGKTYVEA